MKIRLDWAEFVDAAMRDLAQKHKLAGMPKFCQHYAYDSDGECYNFPPDYVEIEIKTEVEA